MNTFLFASIPIVAHTTNPLPFAARLVERGHRVLWYAGRAFHERIAAVGAEPIRYDQAVDFSESQLTDVFPALRQLSGMARTRGIFADAFVGQATPRVHDLQVILARQPVDVMLCDGLMYGVGLCSELGGPAWATFGDGPLPFFDAQTPPFGPGMLPRSRVRDWLRNRFIEFVGRRFVFAEAEHDYGQVRRDLGLPPASGTVLEEAVSPFLHLQGCTPGFEYPRRELPGHCHWIGALEPDPLPHWQPPDWWPEVVDADRAVVLVSQGTMRPDPTELIIPTILALAEEDVLVVVVTGTASTAELEAALGRPLPDNIRCARFIPYHLVLPWVRAFVTNGGYSGVTLALAHGVPLVQAGTTEEKAEIGARIQWTGVGVRLGTSRPAPKTVASGVRRVLHEPSFAAAADLLRREMAHHDAGNEAATLLERLARTQQPVRRQEFLGLGITA